MSRHEALLIDYLLGELTSAQTAEVERQLAQSAALRAELSELGDVTSVVSQVSMPRQPKPQVKQRLLTAVRDNNPALGYGNRLAELFDLNLESANALLKSFRHLEAAEWETNRVKGMRFQHFVGGPRLPEAMDCGLVHLPAGTRYPRHQHGTDEWTLILAGEIINDDGTRLLPGDLNCMAAGSAHAFQVGNDAPAQFAVLTRIEALDFRPK